MIKIVSQNKKTLALIFGLGLFLSLMPLHSANAVVSRFFECGGFSIFSIWDVIECWVSGILDVLLMVPIWIILGPIIGAVAIGTFLGIFGSFIFYAFASLLLDWVASDAFVSLPFTRGGIVGPGLEITTSLVNMLFILVLVFIALATILRLESYGLKKLLPKFLIILLLINFVPVIAGGVIDIANVITDSFLTPNLGQVFLTTWVDNIPIIGSLYGGLTGGGEYACSPGGDFTCPRGTYAAGKKLTCERTIRDCVPGEPYTCGVEGETKTCPSDGKIACDTVSCACPLGNAFLCSLDAVAQSFMSLSGFVGMVVKALAVTFFGIFAGFVLLLYVLLFMMRIIAIWILVILAPIAWFSWILPFTQKFFRMWLSYFLHWAFVGVIAGFFLWLSGLLIGELGALTPNVMVPTEGVFFLISPLVSTLNWLFAFGTVIAFLLVGFFVSLKLAGGGTAAVLKLGEKGMKVAGAFAAARGKRWVKEKVPERVRRIGERMAIAKVPGREMRGQWGALVRTTATPVWALGRAMGKAIGPGILEARKGEIKRAEGEAEKINEESVLLSKVRGASSIDTKIGLVSSGIKKGKGFKKILQEQLSKEEAIEFTLGANKIGAVGEAERIAQATIHKFEKEEREEKLQQMGFKSLEQLKAEGKTDDVKDWEDKKYETITDKIIGEAEKDDIKNFAKGFWKDKAIMEAIQKFWGGPQLGKAADEFGRSFVEKYTEGAQSKGTNWYVKNNPRAALYLTGNAAQDLGFSSLGGLSRTDIRTKIKGVSKKGGKEAIIPEYMAFRKKIGDMFRKIEKLPKEKTIKERKKITILKKEADKVFEIIKKDEDLYEQWKETEPRFALKPTRRGWTPPKAPPPTRPRTPPPSSSPPTPTPSKTPQRSTSPPPSSSSSRPTPTPEGPTWLVEGIKKVKEGTVPTMMPKKLENFLHSHGLSRKEINRLTPKQAWSKAEEIFRESKK